jgi:hypothetical protein
MEMGVINLYGGHTWHTDLVNQPHMVLVYEIIGIHEFDLILFYSYQIEA